MEIPEHLGNRIVVTDDCWEWTGGATTLGYGMLRHEGRMKMAHRVMYEAAIGPIPEGFVIDHLCRNPSCVKPSHLEAVTQKENLRRGIGVGEAGAELQRSKTYCPQGHEYTPENTVRWKNRRICHTCKKDRKRRYDARAKAASHH